MLGQLTGEQIEHVLQSQITGRIGCCAGDDMYVVPVTYVYHQGHIYAHSKEGRKIQIMRRNPKVCFQVDAVAVTPQLLSQLPGTRHASAKAAGCSGIA